MSGVTITPIAMTGPSFSSNASALTLTGNLEVQSGNIRVDSVLLPGNTAGFQGRFWDLSEIPGFLSDLADEYLKEFREALVVTTDIGLPAEDVKGKMTISLARARKPRTEQQQEASTECWLYDMLTVMQPPGWPADVPSHWLVYWICGKAIVYRSEQQALAANECANGLEGTALCLDTGTVITERCTAWHALRTDGDCWLQQAAEQ
ncbi:hypothetical protein OEZ85_002347 [Tetradesmus obliquus]|uniref:Uncharacterized protein n=1 Tax=Tetradesmus obliquus TaxID=3088 RepID=A0ABY8U2P7_TETOB|nr:hypothetical protein OEZ85_002347 [Tetradesmus obliquus]